MSFQQTIIQGNLTRDAEIRQVGDSQVAKVGVAVSEKYKDRQGQIQENVEYFDVEIWDKPGVFQYLTKGQSVLIVGSQKTDKWQDQNGQNRESKKIRAQVVQLCGSRPQQTQPAAPVQPQYGQTPYPPQGQQMPGYVQPPVAPAAPAYPPQPQGYPQPPVPQYQQPAPPQAPVPPQRMPQDDGTDLPF